MGDQKRRRRRTGIREDEAARRLGVTSGVEATPAPGTLRLPQLALGAGDARVDLRAELGLEQALTAAALSELEAADGLCQLDSLDRALGAVGRLHQPALHKLGAARRGSQEFLLSPRPILSIALDCALCAFTVAGTCGVGPAHPDAADAASWYTSGSTLESLFVVVWCGLAVLVDVQLWFGLPKRYKTTNWSGERAVAKTVSRR